MSSRATVAEWSTQQRAHTDALQAELVAAWTELARLRQEPPESTAARLNEFAATHPAPGAPPEVRFRETFPVAMTEDGIDIDEALAILAQATGSPYEAARASYMHRRRSSSTGSSVCSFQGGVSALSICASSPLQAVPESEPSSPASTSASTPELAAAEKKL